MVLRTSRDLVLKKLRDCFPNPAIASEALALLEMYGTQSWHGEKERVQLAILKGSRGELDRLFELVDLADRDYRDALAAAEYPEECSKSLNTPAAELAEVRKRDRAQYEAWLDGLSWLDPDSR